MPQRRRALGAKASRRSPGLRRKYSSDEAVLHYSTPVREALGPGISQDGLPLIGSSDSRKMARKTDHSDLQRPPQAGKKKQPPQTVTSTPYSITPWGGLSLSESSFTSIPQPPPALPAPPAPLSPHIPHMNLGSVKAHSPPRSPPAVALQDAGKSVRGRRKLLPQRRSSRLPPLRPVSNLSFSRSFTFSFFELPLHQSTRSRSDRTRDITLLMRQIQY